MTVLQGSCLCGRVRYQLEGGISDITYCHCGMCQKAHGSAFGAYARVLVPEAFRFVAGEELVRRYRSSADVTRTFCGECGANLQFMRDGRPTFSVAVGSLDSEPETRPVAQIWTSCKAPWHEIANNIPGYEEFPVRK
jgi:hypothetical protein